MDGVGYGDGNMVTMMLLENLKVIIKEMAMVIVMVLVMVMAIW